MVVFTSRASNLVAGDKNSRQDIFVHDRSTGITECVSVDPSGANSNDDSYSPRLSADGRFVTFSSPASNLVSGDTNRTYDIFVHDRSTGVTERISVDSSGVQSNDRSDAPSISADGTTVTFCSYASNLVGGDKNGRRDVFVHDLGTGSTELVSLTTQGSQGSDDSDVSSISSDGSIVAFGSYAPDLVPGDTNGMPDVFVRDRSAGTTERVSVDSSGAEAAGFSEYPSITADGTLVAFTSDAPNLVTDDTNGSYDAFVRDLPRGSTRLVSRAATGEVGNWESGASMGLEISSDGAIVAFASLASNLVSGDTNSHGDLFVVGCTTPASWSTYGSGFPGTKGVPSFRSSQNPVVGTTITLTLENSSGVPTAGLLFVGFSETDLPTAWGGDLLVLPALTIPITFSYGFDSFTGDVPNDWSLCGTTIDLQAFEADPGAAKGVSSTQGLELVLGR